MKLFVYGSLKRGLRNAHYLRNQRFLAEARTLPRYRMFDLGGYPGLIDQSGGEGVSILGELWEVDEGCLRELDELEAVARNLYQRGAVRLDEPFKDEPNVITYFYQRRIDGLKDCGEEWAEG